MALNMQQQITIAAWATTYANDREAARREFNDMKEEIKSEGEEQIEYDDIKQEAFTPSEEIELEDETFTPSEEAELE
ncbi:hypothetical protein L9F63_006867, partial [Diploptera punctata]